MNVLHSALENFLRSRIMQRLAGVPAECEWVTRLLFRTEKLFFRWQLARSGAGQDARARLRGRRKPCGQISSMLRRAAAIFHHARTAAAIFPPSFLLPSVLSLLSIHENGAGGRRQTDTRLRRSDCIIGPSVLSAKDDQKDPLFTYKV